MLTKKELGEPGASVIFISLFINIFIKLNEIKLVRNIFLPHPLSDYNYCFSSYIPCTFYEDIRFYKKCTC